MEGKLSAHGEIFCSIHCLRKFEAEHKLPETAPTAIEHKKISWGSLIPKILIFALGFLFVLGFFVPNLASFSQNTLSYIQMVAPAFLFGLVLASLIDIFIPREIIIALLGQGKKSEIFRAGALGFLSATCSHGCLALSMELNKKGASNASVLTFLLASPWASLPVTILLIRLFGWKGVVIIALAFLVAVTTGLIAQQILKGTDSAESVPYPTKQIIKESWHANKSWPIFSKKFLEAFIAVSRMTAPWVIIGMGLAAVVQTFLSAHIGPWLGRGISGPPLAMALATIMEVCSEGSAPLAFSIYTSTGAALGSVFAFLEAGVVTDFNEISLVWANLGKKSAFALIFLSLPQVLFWGYILNWLF